MASPSFPKEYALLSNSNMTQKYILYVGLVVSGVLDVAKLEETHRRLVELWPALGGVLVKSTTPYSFTSGSKVNFKSRRLTEKLEDVSLIPFTLTSSSKPTYHRFTAKESDRLFHFDTMDKFPPPDTLFALRVTTLNDATLLGFRFAHHLFDGQACYDIVKAYNDLLSGRPIPELISPPDIKSLLSEQVHGDDKLPDTVEPNHPHTHPSSNVVLGRAGFAKYASLSFFKTVLAKLRIAERDDEKMVHLPGEFVERLKKQCQEEMDNAKARGKLEEVDGLELSKDDIITAWLMKKAYAAIPPSSTQGLDIMCGFNYRSFLDPLPPNQLYLHNSFYNIRTSFPSVSQFQSLSLSSVAREFRLTCVRNKQPSAVKAALQFWEQHTKSLISPYPSDRPLRIPYVSLVTHWTTFEYHSLDFSTALDRSGEGGKVLYTQPNLMLPFGITVKPSAMVVKDGCGGYWMRVNLLRSWWDGYKATDKQSTSIMNILRTDSVKWHLALIPPI